jgi:acyl transferase domain-containing protein/acyl carrier protein
MILEEAPERPRSGQSRPYQLLMLSAKSASALENATSNLADYLRCHEELNLADVAYTLQIGRQGFSYRRVIVCRSRSEALDALEGRTPHLVFDGKAKTGNRPVMFLFSGQGSQYPNMGKDLFIHESLFRSEMEQCIRLVRKLLGFDLLPIIYPQEGYESQASEQLKQTSVTQPALFSLEYALAKLWMSWGIRPEGMLGHSIGEYVAACLSGVFSLEDALGLVCERGRMMGNLPDGSMLAVALSERELSEIIQEPLSIAVINGPRLCVVSGPQQAIAGLESRLREKGVTLRRLHTSHAFHGPMMDPIMDPFTNKAGSLSSGRPKVPYISNTTGTWITDTDLRDPTYWSRHLRKAVRFSEGLSQLLAKPGVVLLEVGPGRTLSSLVQRHPGSSSAALILSSIRHPKVSVSDDLFLMESLGRLWLSGVEVDWSGFYANERRYRVPLPTYPFERKRYWIDPKKEIPASIDQASEKRPMSDWFYIPSWKRGSLPVASSSTSSTWLLFTDKCGLGDAMAKRIREQGHEALCVQSGQDFIKESRERFRISPDSADDYKRLLEEMKNDGRFPYRIIHMWSVSEDKRPGWNKKRSNRYQQSGFYSLLYLAQALGETELNDHLILTIISSHLQDINGQEPLCPEKSLLLGPCRVINQEYQNIRCMSVDVEMPLSGLWDKGLLDRLLTECDGAGNETVVAYRGRYRWIGSYDRIRLDALDKKPARLREHGVYMITGGLGGIGSALAAYLAGIVHAKLVLLSRKKLPDRENWDDWLAAQDKQNLISRRIKKIRSLEASGVEVMVFSAELEDEARMKSVVKKVLSRWGRIDGVIHSAGIPGGGIIQKKEPKSAAQVLSSKVIGTRVLERVLSGLNLDFMVLCSSLASILGGIGQADYCAANAFLDSFARYRTLTGKGLTTSINWNAWKETGMAVDTLVPDHRKSSREDRLERFGISDEEGTEIFSRILDRCNEPQVAVSKEDLSKSLEEKERIKEPAKETLEHQQVKPKGSVSLSSHPRPHLSTEYIRPRNDTEKIIANIWQEQLGIDRVGIHDNFFELGGDSLSAIQVISKAREANIRLTPAQIFKYQTIAELALQLDQGRETSSIEHPDLPREERTGHKPSDFSAVTLSRKDLDTITKRMRQKRKGGSE